MKGLLCLTNSLRVIAPPPRQQTGDSLGLERRVRFIETLSADAESAGDVGDGSPLQPGPTKHLIPDLDQVARIEKLVSPKVFVFDRFGVRMEVSLVAESGLFGVVGLRRLISRHICQYLRVNISCQEVFILISHFIHDLMPEVSTSIFIHFLRC